MADGLSRWTLEALNALPPGDFAAALEGVFEHAPWVPAGAAPTRPFESVAALHAALMAVVRAQDEASQDNFLNLHPELAAGALPPGLTEASRAEQGAAGLSDVAELGRLNREYRVRHGIPFMICLRRHTAADVMRRFRMRLGRETPVERAAALEEVAHVSRLRLAARLEAPDAEPPRGALRLRAEDAAGNPVVGLVLALHTEGAMAGEWVTDAAGKASLLPPGDPSKIGRYAILADGVALPFEVRDPARDLTLGLRAAAGEWRLDA